MAFLRQESKDFKCFNLSGNSQSVRQKRHNSRIDLRILLILCTMVESNIIRKLTRKILNVGLRGINNRKMAYLEFFCRLTLTSSDFFYMIVGDIRAYYLNLNQMAIYRKLMKGN